MVKKRQIVDAIADDKGNITQVLIDGNANYTSVKKAIEMADNGAFSNAHAVHPSKGKSYLRTNRDNTEINNLDDMAGDK